MKIDGLLLVNKSIGLSSNAVVQIVKRTLQAEKVGHLGTLDPFASGLLPILVGGASRLAEYVIEGEKIYQFEICFGSETDTLDLTGVVTAEAPIPADLKGKILQVMSQFLGTIEQVPPSYSAIKMNGVPLYQYMRGQGFLPQSIESKTREVSIYDLQLLSVGVGEASFRVKCGKGTYVRSLARDIARSIGTVGHCKSLCREAVFPWKLDNAITIGKDVKPPLNELIERILPPESMLSTFSVFELSDDQNATKSLANGNRFEVELSALRRVSGSNSDTGQPTSEEDSLEGMFFVKSKGQMFLCSDTQSTSPSRRSIQPRKKII